MDGECDAGSDSGDLRRLPSSIEELVALEPGVLGTEATVRGEVLSRRVKSRHLVFCTLQVESGEMLGLCFAAALMEKVEASGTAWLPPPARRNDLAVGARVEAQVLRAPRFRPEPLARRWRLLEAPQIGLRDAKHLVRKDEAHRRAQQLLPDRPLALCKRWSGCAAGDCEASCGFRHYFETEAEEAKAQSAAAARLRSQRLQREELAAYDGDGAGGAHDKAGKRQRAWSFAAWLVQRYGHEALQNGVLDVAGGQGDLSWVLSVEKGIPCTLVDPALRRDGALKSWQRRALRKRGWQEAFSHLAVSFEEKNFDSGGHQALLASASLVVGLHPDEATEAIVDLALRYGRKFAVVPCCVFAQLFPHRRAPGGEEVRTLSQFCAYLRAKDARIQEAMLDFEGRNKDPNCIFIARHIGGLGFQAQEALWHHYTKFGKVKKVLVSPKAKARSRGLRNRPVPLGVVVMETAGGVRKILAQGEEQLVNGHLIKVQGFEKPGKARAKGTARSKANAVSEDGSSGDQVAEGSWEF
ncbi:unnamed protein product [Effrenium voratum]|nr:unnamed protein product [Effrenium voratum]